MTINVTQALGADSQHILGLSEILMGVLVDLEQADGRVRDAAVSADAIAGVIEVDMVAQASLAADAESIALTRILQAVDQVEWSTGQRLTLRGTPVAQANHALSG